MFNNIQKRSVELTLLHIEVLAYPQAKQASPRYTFV